MRLGWPDFHSLNMPSVVEECQWTAAEKFPASLFSPKLAALDLFAPVTQHHA